MLEGAPVRASALTHLRPFIFQSLLDETPRRTL
jgi:hypothetical protein